jgi:hypothetical protein
MLPRDLRHALDPVALALDCGISPDDWQAAVLRSNAPKVLLNCCRQSGKSTVTALLALHVALFDPGLILAVSPSLRQSGELFGKITEFWKRLPGAPEATQESSTSLSLESGARIVSLPGSEKTVRGFSGAKLVLLDEAARVEDPLIAALRPMLATSNGRMVALSTPWGRRGWFFDQWHNGEGWERQRLDARQCPRISQDFLDDELRQLGPLLFAQEYGCEFVDNDEAVFSSALIEAALDPTVEPLFA